MDSTAPNDNPSRPISPESPSSPMTRSLDLSSSTIDDLTSVLSDLNRVSSPEAICALTCCCGKEECENTTSWLAVKSRLESRLILSAEVGQALLQKHEAYIRQVEKNRHKHNLKHASLTFSGDRHNNDPEDISSEEKLSREYDLLAREKAEVEKRLNHALVNNEVTEVSNKTLLQELQEARETISRLTAHHARSMGWDARLTAALKERDDMQQERDSETHRARLAESRFAALKDKTAKLQADVRRLQESLEEKRLHRLESSESILSEARTRLDSVRSSVGLSAKAEQEELTGFLESLVGDNEILKRDNAELQRLLTESREDLHNLQEEVEEQRANAYPPPSRSGPATPLSRHFHAASVSSPSLSVLGLPSRRTFIPETPTRGSIIEPLTPDSSRQPLSPLDSLSRSDSRRNSFIYPRPRHTSASSHVSYELEDDATNEDDSPEVERPKGHRPLLLLNRSRGVQTELWMALPSPSPLPSNLSNLSTPPDPRSESSSFAEGISSHLSALFDRTTALFNKMTQADALSLTNRLKRQNLKGADLSHLSRTTVSNIVAEAIELRSQFRFLLEDEKIVATCTRKDLRVLFKLFKDMFMEMGQLRVSLNDVIFDPSSATRVREFALSPSKAAAEREREAVASQQGANSWITPLSRLFGNQRSKERSPSAISRSNSNSGAGPSRLPRLAPKLGPALAASATTVNVEFSGTGVGRATATLAPPQVVSATPISDTQSISAQSMTSGVMNIFAGAPQPAEADPWVVLPRSGAPRRVQSSFLRAEITGTATIGRASLRKANRLSRNVDAIIDSQQHLTSLGQDEDDDDEDVDFVAPLFDRNQTLSRRGLSDSSIHSTFMSHGGEELTAPSSPTSSPKRLGSRGHSANASIASSMQLWPDRTSVLQALSRTVQNLRVSAAGTMAAVGVPSPSSLGLSAAPAPSGTPDFEPSQTVSATLSAPGTPVLQPARPSAEPGQLAEVPPQTPLTPNKTPRGRNKVRGKVPYPAPSESPSSGAGGFAGLRMPNIGLASWATPNMDMEPVPTPDSMLASTLRAEPFSQRSGRPGEPRALRDFY